MIKRRYCYLLYMLPTVFFLQCSSTNKKLESDYTYPEKRSTIYDTLLMIKNDMDKYDIDLVELRTHQEIKYRVKDVFKKLEYRSLDNKLDKESISLTIDILRQSYNRTIELKRDVIDLDDIIAYQFLYTIREPDAINLIMDISSYSIKIENNNINVFTHWEDLGYLGQYMLINYFSTFDNIPIQEYLDTISATNLAFEEGENMFGDLFQFKFFKKCLLKDMQKKISKGNYTFSTVSEKKDWLNSGFGLPNVLYPVYIKYPTEFDPVFIEIYKQMKGQ